MIIDSHAHYAHGRFVAEFPYLCEQDGAYEVERADRERLLAQMQEHGIVGFIEPSIGFDAIGDQLALVSAHSAYMWASLGVHPTRCIHTPWKNRKKVEEYVQGHGVVAIGETGLDYHHPRQKQHRLRQRRWFIYQIMLAHRYKLPLVLHIREADKQALRILKRYRRYLHGGVVHCFVGDSRLAQQYIALGFVIGIGAKLLGDDAQGRALRDTVRNVPLSCLVVETDAPFVLPDVKDVACSENQRKKLCNSSLILPGVLRRIAQIRQEDAQAVEDAIYQNTVRVFDLGINV